MFWITKARKGISKGQIELLTTDQINNRDSHLKNHEVLHRTSDVDAAQLAYSNYQRRVTLGEHETVRIHAPNGGYLFTLRMGPQGVEYFFDRHFSQQSTEYPQTIDTMPWLNKKAGA